jgi:hypothetical protein
LFSFLSSRGIFLEEGLIMDDKRKHRRFPLRMPVLCEGPGVRDYRTLGLTQNVSQSGLLIEVPRVLAQGSATNLRLLTSDRIAHAEAIVVWTAETSFSLMALQFTMMTSVDHLAWEQLLAFQAGPNPRASLRIPVDFEVTCLIPPGTGVQGRVLNLSDSGMMILLPRVVPPETRLNVAVPAWLILPPVEAQVVWTHPAEPGQGVVHGLHLTADEMAKELFLVGTLLRELLH